MRAARNRSKISVPSDSNKNAIHFAAVPYWMKETTVKGGNNVYIRVTSIVESGASHA